MAETSPLTDHEAQALYLHDDERMTYREAAKAAGWPVNTMKARYARGRAKLVARAEAGLPEIAEPGEVVPANRDLRCEQLKLVRRLAEISGRSVADPSRLLARFERAAMPEIEDGEATNEWMKRVLVEKMQQELSFMDPFVMAQANLKDLTSSFVAKFDRLQLLKGEPTSILRHEDRRKLNELVVAVIKDARRRGITMDAEFEEVG